ncbi:PAS domain-containing protein [Caulobacter sp. RL271]|uniref:histidine kinase n=1 Tax=Caulobacter segnis TaxID=88688 RepID=A0ABY4ZWF8_9CAUL|nr:PAS domain-containing protein [Caulobacter segnis]USQ97065.1 PAS domain-containing protein [Caulobacter segnis]
MGDGKPRATPVLTRLADGEMAGRVRAFDWSTTPLGSMDDWSPALRLATDMILATSFPMALRWGPELVLIYNDAYSPALREDHPQALGMRFSDNAQALQASLRAPHDDILSGASGGFAFERLPLKVSRGGGIETGYFTVRYSPMPDPTTPSGVGGVMITAVEISQSVADQKALRTTQERYEMAREAAGVVGAWQWDLKANKVYADARYAELHNVAPELAGAGLPAQSYTPAVHPEDRDKVRAVALKAARAGGEFSHEYRLLQADGSVRWIYTRGRAYLDENGQPDRNAGVIVDITERKQVEADLAAARLDLDLAAQAAGMGRWDHKPHLGQRYWDDRARRIFGLTLDEAPSQDTFERLLHPDDVPGCAPPWPPRPTRPARARSTWSTASIAPTTAPCAGSRPSAGPSSRATAACASWAWSRTSPSGARPSITSCARKRPCVWPSTPATSAPGASISTPAR